jgi:hypothetical protein
MDERQGLADSSRPAKTVRDIGRHNESVTRSGTRAYGAVGRAAADLRLPAGPRRLRLPHPLATQVRVTREMVAVLATYPGAVIRLGRR